MYESLSAHKRQAIDDMFESTMNFTKKFVSRRIETPAYKQLYLAIMDDMMDRYNQSSNDQEALYLFKELYLETVLYHSQSKFNIFNGKKKYIKMAYDQTLDILNSLQKRFDI